MVKLKDGFNSMHNGLFHQNYECTCNICRPGGEIACVVNNYIVSNVKNLCDHILCPKGDIDEFHKKHCIEGNCAMCGVSTL
jgi:hypothetical protein